MKKKNNQHYCLSFHEKTNVLPKTALTKFFNTDQVTIELLDRNFLNIYPRPTKKAYEFAKHIFRENNPMFMSESSTPLTKQHLQRKYRSWYPPFSKTVTVPTIGKEAYRE